MFARFQISRSRSGQFSFRLVGAKGEVILVSRVYQTKANAQTGIAAVKKNFLIAGRVEKQRGKGKQQEMRVVLKAANRLIVGHSEWQTDERRCNELIQLLRKHAGGAQIEDLTKARK